MVLLAKAAAIVALVLPLTAAGKATAYFHCSLGRGGVAIFHVANGPNSAYAHLHKPSGGQWILHLGGHFCDATGCLESAGVPRHKGWYLDTIVESGNAAFLEHHQCR